MSATNLIPTTPTFSAYPSIGSSHPFETSEGSVVGKTKTAVATVPLCAGTNTTELKRPSESVSTNIAGLPGMHKTQDIAQILQPTDYETDPWWWDASLGWDADLEIESLRDKTEKNTELKLPSGSVSTNPVGLPGIQATQSVKEILKPIKNQIRELTTCEVTGIDSVAMFDAIMSYMINSSVAGHPLWKQQMDKVMNWSNQFLRVPEIQFFRKNITSISHDKFVQFCNYSTSREGFADSLCQGCLLFMHYIKFEKQTLRTNENLEVNDVSEIMKKYVKEYAEKSLQLEAYNFRVDFWRACQQITIPLEDWDVSLLGEEAFTPVWQALCDRIVELTRVCVGKRQPLQIVMEINCDVNPSFITGLHNAAVKNGIFVVLVSATDAPLPILPDLVKGHICSQGLSCKNAHHANKLSAYLKKHNLLSFET